ncbi:unnamed protein product [Miscanthus lutarioriparius]|uniref:Uncharacterized protein n=1 Tax=Miscanthus lutarioriparius TaxID=422564 RepID=A0A811NQI3_9POAL|nr:unnamed protein product [Miscanthus lutarioriparius]
MDGGDVATGGGRGTSIHIMALDGIVNVNSLFTLAAFLGLAWRPSSDGPGLADGADPRTGNPCAAGDRAESDLVSFHVLAFACFLFSSLVALCLKPCPHLPPPPRPRLRRRPDRADQPRRDPRARRGLRRGVRLPDDGAHQRGADAPALENSAIPT